MNAAEAVVPTVRALLGWSDICDQHPNEWVCLVEVEHQTDGQIRSASVVGHHRSLKSALQQVESWSPDRMVAYAHTGGRKLRLPRLAMTDAIRDILRARR
jgi:hypothetical protein